MISSVFYLAAVFQSSFVGPAMLISLLENAMLMAWVKSLSLHFFSLIKEHEGGPHVPVLQLRISPILLTMLISSFLIRLVASKRRINLQARC